MPRSRSNKNNNNRDKQKEQTQRNVLPSIQGPGALEEFQLPGSRLPASGARSRSDTADRLTGNFREDFVALCKDRNLTFIPLVSLRPKIGTGSSTPLHVPIISQSNEGKIEKKRNKKGESNVQPLASETERTEVASNIDVDTEKNMKGAIVSTASTLIPCTYTTRDRFQYFKPCIQVELAEVDRFETVSELYIKGWKIDDTMMEIFQKSWPILLSLHTINLWNTGLREETLRTLSEFLPRCTNVTTVVLDGNPVQEENWEELLGKHSLIRDLSLKHCKITDTGAARIGRAIGTAHGQNMKLLALNLTGNEIGDKGAESLANGLKFNRTLMSLTLTNNKVGDKGATKIAEALRPFPLAHEEVVIRRKLHSDRECVMLLMESTTSVVPMASLVPVSAGSAIVLSNTNTCSNQSTSSAETSISDRRRNAILPLRQSKKEYRNNMQNIFEGMHLIERWNSLFEPVHSRNGELWNDGNMILVNLNISRNEIREDGLRALLASVRHQGSQVNKIDESQRHLYRHQAANRTGLQRLVVTKNLVPENNKVLEELKTEMMSKSPLLS